MRSCSIGESPDVTRANYTAGWDASHSVLGPFVFVLVAVYMLPWRRVFLSPVIAQAIISGVFLNYIDQKGGASRGEYGASYVRQGNR
jgi:hypothetical protein